MKINDILLLERMKQLAFHEDVTKLLIQNKFELIDKAGCIILTLGS